jgi:hypothetical protein
LPIGGTITPSRHAFNYMRSKTMDKLEIGYTVDLLARLTESIETYLDDDRWDGIDAMHKEIKEANKLIRKYYKRINALEVV